MFSLRQVFSLCICNDTAAEVSEEVRFKSGQGDFSTVNVSPQCAVHKEQLDELFRSKPYLKSKEHELAFFIDELCKAIENGNTDEAQNCLDILQMKLDLEEKNISAAFKKFDHSGDGVLAKNEVKFMLDYLGFPDTQEDVDKLMNKVDTSRDGTIQFDEFLRYVGKVGGTGKLFEIRRQQIQERGGFKGSMTDPDNLRVALQECGINPEAQAHWRLTASESELDSAAQLRPCQQAAIRHIRNLAQENHERALPELQKRVQKLGYTDTELFMALSWVRELAPLLVHINLDKVGQFFMQDTHYRNQFETKTSGGLLKTSAREKWERGLFGTAYDGARPAERPKYGVQNIWNDPRGVVGARQYGDSYIVLKDIRLRCTLSPQDSANLPARRLAVLDYYAHVLLEYSDKELKETIRVAEKGDEKVGDSEKVVEKWGMYKEAQLHGEIDLRKHVDRLVANERHRKQADWVESICKKNGWTLTWMDEMRTHLEDRQSGVELDAKQWPQGFVHRIDQSKVKMGRDMKYNEGVHYIPAYPRLIALSLVCGFVSSEVLFQSVQGDFSAVEVSPQCTAHKDEQLDELFRSRPYLLSKEHELAFFIDELRKSIASGNADEAQNNLDILQMKLDLEEKHIAAAFNKFDHSRDGVLAKNEVTFMLDYLGFPDTQEDVDKLMSIVDTSRDGTIQFDEFLRYVGKVGGTGKLFEIRRQQIQERGGFKGSMTDPDNLRVAMQECGINPEAQAHWRLTASESELDSAAQLRPCQQAAIRHIRNLAQENHERALPELQRRVQTLGYTDTELWMVLSWIRELAPLIVHINLDKAGQFFLKDTHYRNQFETKTSGGLLKTSAREKWERGLFGTAYDDAKPAERPKYGVQNIWNDPRGVVGARQYGDSYIVLKDFRLRCTLSPQDSANLPARKLAVLDYYAHVLLEYSDKELKEAIRVAEKGDEKVGDSEKVVEKWGMYKEAQLHGEIDLRKHVDRLVANERHRKQADWVKKLCKKNGWTLTWMDDMRAQLEDRQSGVELDVKQWQLRCIHLARYP
ncbi:cal-1 [Symbiodinium sp. CCMP2456]|nr:cal-1 [Symbiodinium sp. CCMP2456]